MKHIIGIICAFGMCLVGAMTPASAANLAEMRAMTAEMIARAAQHYAMVGHSVAADDFNTLSDDWYAEHHLLHMFGMGMDGRVWAYNVWPELIGIDFSYVTDFHGFEFGRDILKNTPENGSPYEVQVHFMDPQTGQLIPSIGTCIRPDEGNILCSWTNG